MSTKKMEPATNPIDGREQVKPICGIIMPIAAMVDYEQAHWERVRQIIDKAVQDAGYNPQIVSESADIGVIHSRIVQNIYDNPIAVCDVSGKNPNVMFELGLRLAFDKPVIIIKDEKTNYSFDTSPIEHLDYRSDLRYQDSIQFMEKLTAKIIATVEKKENDPEYSPFLKHFGKFKVAEINEKEASPAEYVVHRLNELQRSIDTLLFNRNQSLKAPHDTSKFLQWTTQAADTYNSISEHTIKNLIGGALANTEAKSEEEAIEYLKQFLPNFGINPMDAKVQRIIRQEMKSRLFVGD